MEKRSSEIILYSASPRRRELLERLELPYRVMPVDADESIPDGLKASDVVTAISLRKLEAGRAITAGNPHEFLCSWGLAADTLVEGPGGLLGKPSNENEAAGMLESLSGIPHQVHSAFVVSAPGNLESAIVRTCVHSTTVVFRNLGKKEIDDYIATGEWQGAAGGYRIQERGEILVDKIEGLWSTVVGLPLGPLYGILSELSYPFR